MPEGAFAPHAPDSSPFPLRRLSFAGWLIRGPLWGFLAFLLATGAAGFYSLNRYLAASRSMVDKELLAIADLKVRQIAAWYKERQADATVVAGNPLFFERIRQILADPEQLLLRRDLQTWMDTELQSYDYARIVLCDAAGNLVMSSPVSPKGISPCPISEWRDLPRMTASSFLDLQRDEDTSGIQMDLVVPIRRNADSSGKIEGVLSFHIDPYRFLYPLVQSWPTRSDTAETLLVRREGEEVVFLNELRHRKNTALTFRQPLSGSAPIPAALAVQGRTGIVEASDYRSIPVIAALKDIPGTPWFMVAKIDREEIYAPFRLRAWMTAGLFFSLFLMTAMSLGLVWRRFDSRTLQRELYSERRHRRQVQEAESSLRREQEFTRSLLNHLSDGVVACDAQGNLALFNHSARLWHGMDAQKIPPDQWAACYRLFQEDGKTPLPEDAIPLRRAFRGEKVHDVGMTILAQGQPLRHLLASGGPFFDENQARLGAVVVMRDVTERRKAQEEIERLNRELEQRVMQRTAELKASNEELESFAYSVSHDLRAPLRGIDGWSLALQEEFPDQLDAKGRGYLQRVRSESQRMGRLIDDLLRLSRVTRAEMVREKVDLSRLAQSVARQLQEEKPAGQVEFHIFPHLHTTGDARLMEVALQNLFSNALKYSSTQPVVRIEFGKFREEDQSVYYVRDNGIGFDMAYAGKLFRPFQRLHKSSEYPGTGIGLATIQRIVHRHGGKIWVKAQPKQGATFYFTLPEAM